MADGPIFRSPADVAEAVAVHRLSQAESAGWQVMDSLPSDVKAQLFALINSDDVPRI